MRKQPDVTPLTTPSPRREAPRTSIEDLQLDANPNWLQVVKVCSITRGKLLNR